MLRYSFLLIIGCTFFAGCFNRNEDPSTPSLAKTIKKSAKNFISCMTSIKKSKASYEYRNTTSFTAPKNKPFHINIVNGNIQITGTNNKTCSIKEQIFSYKSDKEKNLSFINKADFTVANEDNDYITDYAITVPQSTVIKVMTTNGTCKIINISESITAETTNGSIKLYEVKKPSKASTTNGSITSYISSNNFTKAEYSTINGSIKVTVLPTNNIVINAQTVRGSITTNFDAQPKHNFAESSLQKTIGKGSNQLTCSTVNGSITVRQQA